MKRELNKIIFLLFFPVFITIFYLFFKKKVKQKYYLIKINKVLK